MKIIDMKVGEKVFVLYVEAEKQIQNRLAMLGIYPNAEVCLLRYSLFKSSLLLESDGVKVGLRKELAKKITVMRV